jgi:hypothetical protein
MINNGLKFSNPNHHQNQLRLKIKSAQKSCLYKAQGMLVLCLLSINACCFAANPTVVKQLALTSNNLSLLALKLSQKKVKEQYLQHLMLRDNYSDYLKFEHDQARIKQLLNNKDQELSQKLSVFDHNPVFILQQRISIESFSHARSTIDIRNFLIGATKYILRSDDDIKDGLPDHFLLLFANLELLKDIKVEYLVFDKLGKDMSTLFLEAKLQLPKLQNDKYFQTVISSFKLYQSPQKKQLLASVTEQRPVNDIINNWFLAGGFSNSLVGIHGFSFLGYRLQDMFSYPIKAKKYCKKTQKLSGHQIIVCNKAYTENSRLIITYVGGKVARLDLIASNKLNKAEKRKISKYIMSQLKQSTAIFDQDISTWSKYNVDFAFHSGIFFDQTNPQSRYQPLFAKTDPDHANNSLIITMMASASKKFIEEIK